MSETSASPHHRWTPGLAAVAALAVGVGSVFMVIGTFLLATPTSGIVLFLGVLGAFALAYRGGLQRRPNFLALWVGVAVVLALVSVVTGFFNGLTDEPYATPAFIRLLPDLYGKPLELVYYQYGSGPLSVDAAYIYLPLLAFVQVPGLDYRWVTVGAWALMVYLVRRSGPGVLLLGSPWVALVAANGFNDLVPLVALTLTFASLRGWPARVAEVVSLGLKQFANAVIVVYYLWNRRWREALLAVGITIAFLVPFAILDLSGVLCHAVLLDPQPACGGGYSGAFSTGTGSHLNYYVWLLWLLAVFGPAYVTRLKGPEYAPERAELARVRGVRPEDERNRTEAAWSLVLLPFFRVRTWLGKGKPPAGAG
jgi:hypothetical protein